MHRPTPEQTLALLRAYLAAACALSLGFVGSLIYFGGPMRWLTLAALAVIAAGLISWQRPARGRREDPTDWSTL